MARSPRSLFAAPLVVTVIAAAPAPTDADERDRPEPKAKVRFDGYQCFEGPEGQETSVACPRKLLPRAKKRQPVWQEQGGFAACRTLDRKQVRCPPNLILPEPLMKSVGNERISLDPGTLTCESWVSIQCPRDATCNPPPPQPVECPDDLLPKLAKKVKPTKKKRGKCYLGKVRVACP